MKNISKVLGLFVATLFVANVALADTNNTDIEQIDGDVNTSDTAQTGERNDIDVEQDNTAGSTSNNDTDVIQNGDDNIVNVIQNTTAGSGTVGNTIDIEQQGNLNKVRGAAVSVGGPFSSITVGSAADQDSKSDNTLFVRQTGNSHDIGLDQDSANGTNNANIVQNDGAFVGTGAAHSVAIVQHTTGGSSADLTDANVDQLSAGSSDATNFQSGASASIYTLHVHD